jgi:2-polyprenyl-3-methyl-5-hydroxy-6-metoxy-1,4-benzoquinol methylase
MTTGLGAAALDEERVQRFMGRLMETYTAGMVTFMIDLAHRTGLLDAMATGPGTSIELAARAGLQERYVRECLGALVTAGIVEYDAAGAVYTLPPEHAVCLSGDGSLNLAPYSLMNALLGKHIDAVAGAFREGGGLPYDRFRPEFTSVMDGLSRGLMDGQLLHGILPAVDDLPARLASGIRVADVGCGTGHAVNLMAREFPHSTFIGYDIGADAIEAARAEAADYRLSNASFEVRDVATLPTRPSFDVIFAFDSIHDQVDPSGVLRQVYEALDSSGLFVMMDIKANTPLEENIGNPFAPLLYSMSTLHCLTVSLAHGGAGLGTMWGQQRARTMLTDAGFTEVDVSDVPDDPMDVVYVARKTHPERSV